MMAHSDFRLDKRKGIRFIAYSIAAIAVIFCMVLTLNFFFLCVAAYQNNKLSSDFLGGGEIREALTFTKEGYVLSSAMRRQLDGEKQWAMLLDARGQVVWSYGKPEELGTSYSRSDIARMAKWYLQGYPVRMRVWDDEIMVVGMQKDTVWKYTMEFSLPWLDFIKGVILWFFLINFVWIILLAIFFTRRWMQRREKARIEWVGGISHDIRTPLSMVMGYADTLEKSGNLSEEERQQAAVIRHQSIIMKELISDLNLISRLEYSMEALRREKVRPAVILREVAAGFLNDSVEEELKLELEIQDGDEEMTVNADRRLLVRAFRNLIGNSIQHSGQQDCVTIWIRLRREGRKCIILFEDDGAGYPALSAPRKEARGLQKDRRYGWRQIGSEDAALNIRGLEIVEKIVQAHGGKVCFGNRSVGGSFCEIRLKTDKKIKRL